MDSTGNGHIMRYDGTSSDISSGLLRKQQTTAFSTGEITGNYAFGAVGADQNSNRFAVAGELTANGSASFSGEADYDNGCPSGSCSGNVGNTTLNSTVSPAQIGSHFLMKAVFNAERRKDAEAGAENNQMQSMCLDPAWLAS